MADENGVEGVALKTKERKVSIAGKVGIYIDYSLVSMVGYNSTFLMCTGKLLAILRN